ncbi:multidrug ABC transporter substrate-binding protein [Ventosimonas gracilis]|uniref:Multidrug ABC transporter substrate-binding protein n=1 Tax=Ventosimonas gracilis TaxID=1680762 RepID=A0A139SR38_9GAMM|nr:lipoprotein-releasing ABC transporter permease subunit [Ventosimonas gracilis]KXU37046.1 multidrug ABC transporter substrate-binding protein [Ventosimonas gracilis]
MFHPLPLFIGTRWLRAKRRNHFISFISLASMLGLALGVLALIVVLSVMNGFREEMSGRILGLLPHLIISGEQPLNDWQQVAETARRHPQVIGVAPFASLSGMLSFRGAMQPVTVGGIDPSHEAQVSLLPKHIVQGQLTDLAGGQFGLVLGENSARRLRAQIGDKLTLIIPEASDKPGGITPRMQRLTLLATFHIGAALDDELALIHINDAAHILRLNPGQVPGVRLKLSDSWQAPLLAKQFAEELGPGFRTSDWSATQGSLFAAMKMEKTMITVLLLLIVAVAAFNIVATLIMVVADKRPDIAILRTMGASSRQILLIFMVQGSLIGLAGTLIGTVLGVLAALNVSELVAYLEAASGRPLFGADLFVISHLPSKLQSTDVLLIAGASLALSFLATIHPARRAAQTNPAEALH